MLSGRLGIRRAPLQKDNGDTAFPTRQMFILGMQRHARHFREHRLANQALALSRICEPIAFMSIFPYIYYMVKSFEITDDERQIALYAGMVTSAFAMAEFLASIFWGRLSDRVGRKPIILTGLAGTGVSMLLFGFAKNLPIALFARALGGILNGYVHVTKILPLEPIKWPNIPRNIGVLQTTVAEVTKVEAHRRKWPESNEAFMYQFGPNYADLCSKSLLDHAVRLVSWVSFDTTALLRQIQLTL
jgi:MFS transporter